MTVHPAIMIFKNILTQIEITDYYTRNPSAWKNGLDNHVQVIS